MGPTEGKVSDYNPRSKNWRRLPSWKRDNRLYVLGHGGFRSEVLDLSDDNPEWRKIANTNSGYDYGAIVMIDRKIYAFGGVFSLEVEAFDVDQGKRTSTP